MRGGAQYSFVTSWQTVALVFQKAVGVRRLGNINMKIWLITRNFENFRNMKTSFFSLNFETNVV